ncbi:hypothetical protein L2E82_32354 [Cichorium intybus]|uniref:Uncharacterized protein n=1 Tax=Cichorium intybus TaxID=13427 RepID=A0ACB9BJ12_CICIN|nr:hypothetical protein L2E82_32354 [Cichorium intybus]
MATSTKADSIAFSLSLPPSCFPLYQHFSVCNTHRRPVLHQRQSRKSIALIYNGYLSSWNSIQSAAFREFSSSDFVSFALILLWFSEVNVSMHFVIRVNYSYLLLCDLGFKALKILTLASFISASSSSLLKDPIKAVV